jgi:hypothetical protein
MNEKAIQSRQIEKVISTFHLQLNALQSISMRECVRVCLSLTRRVLDVVVKTKNILFGKNIQNFVDYFI